MKVFFIALFLVISSNAFAQEKSNITEGIKIIDETTKQAEVLLDTTVEFSIKENTQLIVRKKYRRLIENVLSGEKFNLFKIKKDTISC